MQNAYFNNVFAATRLMLCNQTPLFFGKAGIGKSKMVKWSAKIIEEITGVETDVINFVGSQTKEGDLTGLPIAVQSKKFNCTITDFAINAKIRKVLENDQNGKFTIIFLDEINRATKEVLDEMMELIEARCINGTKLPDSVMIVAAANPDTGDEDYQVQTLNAALLDRMFVFDMSTDAKSWIEYALGNSKNIQSKFEKIEDEYLNEICSEDFPIHDKIVNFIGEHTELLYTEKQAGDYSLATPRGWEKFNKIFCYLEHYCPGTDFLSLVHDMAKAKLGTVVASAFISYLRNNEHPMIDIGKVIEGKIEMEKAIETISGEVPIRQMIIVDRGIKYMEELISTKKIKSDHENRFIKIILESINKDLMIGTFNNIFHDHKQLHDKLRNNANKKYRDEFLAFTMQADAIKNL